MEKYKITKTIRFKLLPDKIQDISRQVAVLQNSTNAEKKNNLLRLIQRGQELPKLLNEYIRYSNNHKLKSEVTVHFRWLRLFTKDLFYNWKKDDAEKKIKISDVDYLSRVFEDFFNEWETVIERINTDCNRPEESKTRDAEIAFSIKKIATKQMFPFIKSFVYNSNYKNSEETKSKLTALLNEFETVLKICEQNYLPSQSAGIVIAKASFNYYTINKKQKDYKGYTDDIEKIEKGMNSKFHYERKYDQLLEELNLIALKELPLIEFYSKIKSYKSTRKIEFSEAVSKGLAFADLKSKFPLFQTESNKYAEFLELTGRITQISTAKSLLSKDNPEAQKLRDEIKKLRINRGEYFKNNFHKYISLCNLYKKIADKKGRLKGQVKGIENERIDSQRIQHWALVLEDNLKHSLILIPKEKVTEVYRKVRASKADSTSSSSSLYYFESMTYRALHKLCFGVNGNTFLPEIQKELPEYNPNKQSDFGEFCFHKSNTDKEIDEPKLISFYQSVLKTNYVKDNLNLPQSVFDEATVQTFETRQDFQIALEKCCYAKKTIISETLKKEILEDNNVQIFQITSLDLQRSEQKNLKAHTKIWNRFWTKQNETANYDLRLNPETAIVWRKPKKTRIDKYGAGTSLYDPKKRNRYLHEQYTLCTTVTDNALNNEITFAFEDTKKKGTEIVKYNEKINQTLKKEFNKNQLWFYGIDAGEIELATLALMNKDKEPQLFTVYELKKSDFFKHGYIYNKERELVIREKPYKAIQNLSYFLNEELYEKTFRDGKFQETFNELFKEKHVSAIDLTTAKVINGKIILNGDMITFLNLRILHAKRKIYEELIINPQAELKENEKEYYLYFDKEGTEKVEKIYRSRLDFEHIKPYQEIRNDLNAYFKNVQKNEAKVEDQINQTRRALVGNMIGVIYYLYQKYRGIISIEDLKQTKVESDRNKFEGNIERPLEWALYRKFQQEGYVPPISELIKLRELEKFPLKDVKQPKYENIQQFGIIKFVSPEETSTTCPSCEKKAYELQKEKKGEEKPAENKRYEADKKAGVFCCPKCGFHNRTNPMGYESLDSNDKVAAFNIAKRGFEDLQKHK
jgi:hypothetical protein